MEQPHKPAFYVSGVYIQDWDEWRGDFHATAGELWRYAEYDVTTVEEYDLVLRLISAQQEYMMWWDRVTKTQIDNDSF